jgi:hypothetical protein
MPISLNGISFNNYHNVVPKPRRVGVMHEALNATSSWLHRADKTDFDITWKGVEPTTLTTIRNNVYAVTSPFPYTHEDGTNYTVLVEPGSFSITPIQTWNGLLYDISLTVRQR